MTIGILTAMSVEYDQIERLLVDKCVEENGPHRFSIGKIGPHRIVLLQCGMGKVNAAAGASSLIMTYRPTCVLSTGCAGGIGESLCVGDVVVSKEVCYHDVFCGDEIEIGQIQGLPRTLEGNAKLLQVATSLHTNVKVMAGQICSGDRFVTSAKDVETIKAIYPQGLACDMESMAIAHVCHLWKVAFLSFRIISDTPGIEGHYQTYFDFWKTMAERSFTITHEFLTQLEKIEL